MEEREDIERRDRRSDGASQDAHSPGISSNGRRATPGDGVEVGVVSGARQGAVDLSAASTEEILDVKVDPHMGGGGGGMGRGRRPSAYATRDLTTGSIPKNLWFLSWPQMVEGVLNVLDQMADLFWAGHFVGARAIAGLGVAQSYTQLIMTGRMGLDTGMQAMIARAIGAGRVALANHVALQAFTITAAFSLLMVTIGFLFTDFLLRILGVSDEVVGVASLYMKIQFIGFGGQAFRMMTGSALQASGDPLTAMKATLLARVVHIILSPILFFGVGPLPRMELAGLAVGNVAAQSLAVAWNSYALFAGTSRLHLTLRGYRLDFPLLWRLIKIGAPASATGMERSFVQLALVRLVTPFGDFALAAYSLTRRMEMFTNLGAMGLGRASGILVGQNLGAGEPERARATVWWALGFVSVIRGTMGILLLIFPILFIAIFSNEADLRDVAINWVRIQAIGGIVMGAGMVFQQSFNVAGDTMTPLKVTLVSMVLIEVPLAYVLAYHTPMDQYGIPLAITVAMLLRTLLYFPFFLGNRWLQKQVID